MDIIMNYKDAKIMNLYIGSPPPSKYFYMLGFIDVMFNYTEKELKKENKRRLKLYKKDYKQYLKNRLIELKELNRLLIKKKDI